MSRSFLYRITSPDLLDQLSGFARSQGMRAIAREHLLTVTAFTLDQEVIWRHEASAVECLLEWAPAG